MMGRCSPESWTTTCCGTTPQQPMPYAHRGRPGRRCPSAVDLATSRSRAVHPSLTSARSPRDHRTFGRQGNRPSCLAQWTRVRTPQRLGCRLRPHPGADRLPGHRHDECGHRLVLRSPGRRSAGPRHDARARRSHRGRSRRAGDRGPRSWIRRHTRRRRPHRGPGRGDRGGGRQSRGRRKERAVRDRRGRRPHRGCPGRGAQRHLRAERPR